MRIRKGALAHLARPGAEISVQVTPGARAETVAETPEGLRLTVTAPPADGQANAAVQALLARALGVPKSSLALVRGAKSREKVWRLD